MSAESDRNLLFLLLALQNGYINTKHFLKSTAIWMKEPTREIGGILVDLEILLETEHQRIRGLVDDRIRRLGGLDASLDFTLQTTSMPDPECLPKDWQERIDIQTKTLAKRGDNSSSKRGPWAPTTGLARYEIGTVLGIGGQGIVFEAVDRELKRRVALKRVKPELLSDPEMAQCLIEEAQLASRFDHGGIAPVYDIGADEEGNPFFVMQLIRGEKLSDKTGSINYKSNSKEQFIIEIRPLVRRIIDVCNTLQYAYDKFGIIHQDLKPQNIMVDRYGETIVVDWGMGRKVQLVEGASIQLPISSNLDSNGNERGGAGTPGYLSPEQAQSISNLDHRTDIWGIGATLYKIATGQTANRGANRLELLENARKNLYLRPTVVNPLIPKELEAICLKAMASQPENRYQNATDLASDLESWIAGDPVSALPENFVRKSERFLRKHARAVIASLLGLTLAVLGLTLANVIISGQKKEIARQNRKLVENEEELNSQLEKIQKLVKDLTASRRVASATLEEVVGSLFDDRLSQVPGANEIRIGLLTDIATKIETYLVDNPDDTELKLDLVRLLTRLAKLEGENNKTQEATKHWQRAEELLKETKDTPDQVFQINWKKIFCDNSYYQTSALLKQGLVDQADALVKEACSIADQYQDSLKGDIKEEQKFAPSYVRLYRQRASILARRENWAQALDETVKARGILQPFIAEHLPKLTEEPDSTGIIDSLELGELGYYALLCEDQGDYETLLIRYLDAEKTFLHTLQACKLAPRIENAARDGIIRTSKLLRKLQRIALMTNDFPGADKYYQQAVALISKQRLSDPEVESAWFYIESDRARGLAGNNADEARNALKRAMVSLDKIQTDPAAEYKAMRGNEITMAKVFYSIAAAKSAVANSDGNEEELQRQQNQEKTIQLDILKKRGTSPLELRELLFLP